MLNLILGGAAVHRCGKRPPFSAACPILFRARREKSSPGGASELSPALQRWESGRDDSSPGEPALSAVEGTKFSRTLLRTDVSVYCRALHESPRNPTPETTVESHPQKTKARHPATQPLSS